MKLENFLTRRLTPTDWEMVKQNRLSETDSATFGLFNKKNEIIGLTGIVRDKNDSTTAWMVSSYVQSAYRRLGLTKLLYECRIQWAKEQNDIQLLVIHHHKGNEISRKAHQKFNFQFIKEYPPSQWPNGEFAPYVEYHLRIKS